MSCPSELSTVILTSCIGAALTAFVFIAPLPVAAGDAQRLTAPAPEAADLPSLPDRKFSQPTDLSRPHRHAQPRQLVRRKHLARPSYLQPRDTLTSRDEIAAMEAIHIALSEVADGATYVWHRKHGRLSAIVKPTTSFRDRRGKICRHIYVLLNSGVYSRRSEGVACRQSNGIWSLEG